MVEKDFSGFEPTAREDATGDVLPQYGLDEQGAPLDPVNGPRFPVADTEVPHDRFTDPTPPGATHFSDDADTSVIPGNVRELADRARQRYPDGFPNSAAGATAEYDDRINGRHQG